MLVRSQGIRTLAAALVAGLASAAVGQELNGRIETIIASAKIGTTAVVGVCAIDVESGRMLVDVRGDTPLIPASNQKLLTTGTALIVLGPEFLFKTEVVLSGDKLVLRGGGDPAFADPTILDRMSPKLTVDRMVAALAGAVNTAGIVSVSEVVADDRIFDRTLIHETWPKDQLDRWYCAPVSGLNFHTNVVSVFPAPTRIGQAPGFEIQPNAPWFEIENRARTVGEGGKNSVWMARDEASGQYTLHGEVRFASRSPIEVTVFDPGLIFAQLMAAELPKAGVAVGPVPASPSTKLSMASTESVLRQARLASTDELLDGRVLAVVSTHMKDVIQRCNADSQNLYAEAILKRIGREVTKEPGSWENGSSIVRMTLSQDEELGPKHAASTVVADGSGMSREDRVAPRTLAKWLTRLQKDATFGELFVDSLAAPGDGTLRRRFQGAELTGELKAKSGKIAGVRCLSGYVTDPVTKRRVAFSVMINNMKDSDPQPSLKLHEDVVVALDRWLVAQRPDRTANVPNQSVTRKRR